MLLPILTFVTVVGFVLLAAVCCAPVVNVVRRDDELQERMLLAWQIAKNYMSGNNRYLVSRNSVITYLSIYILISLLTATACANILLLRFGWMPTNLSGDLMVSLAIVAVGATILVSMSAVALFVLPMALFAALKAVVRIAMRSDSACFVLFSSSSV